MQIGYIGLGKMGKNMVLRLLQEGVAVTAWNRSPKPLETVVAAGATGASSIEELVSSLRKKTEPIIVWLMLPSGEVTDTYIDKLTPLLRSEDILIDGANSRYTDTLRRATRLSAAGIHFVDVAVSGGPSGALNGACLMVGGTSEDINALQPILEKIAAPKAFAHLGPVGAGHFAKMVHNGIEYGMMQAIAEGAAVLKKAPFPFDLARVFEIYNNRSVIESRLVGWAQAALQESPDLEQISSTIAHSGEGAWTVETAKELGVNVPIIEESLNVRKRSVSEPASFRNKMVTALRGQFGGHATR